MRDLHAAFRARDLEGRSLPALPVDGLVDNREAGYTQKDGIGGSVEDAKDSKGTSNFDEEDEFRLDDDAEKSSVKTNPSEALALRYRRYRDSSNSPVLHNKLAFKDGDGWRMAALPLSKQDRPLDDISEPAEVQPIIGAHVLLGDTSAFGWQAAQDYAEYVNEYPGDRKWKWKIDQVDWVAQIDHSQPESRSSLTRVVSGIQRGLHSIGRRGSVVVTGMKTSAETLSSAVCLR
ncbi:Nn.00g091820.m01.CDS01 [Neocucurbitaria sp. VM-36]